MARISTRAKGAISRVLVALSAKRHASIPLESVRGALTKWGITMEDMILCGRSGSANIDLQMNGDDVTNAMLCIQWHRGDNDNMYEFNGYIS